MIKFALSQTVQSPLLTCLDSVRCMSISYFMDLAPSVYIVSGKHKGYAATYARFWKCGLLNLKIIWWNQLSDFSTLSLLPILCFSFTPYLSLFNSPSSRPLNSSAQGDMYLVTSLFPPIYLYLLTLYTLMNVFMSAQTHKEDLILQKEHISKTYCELLQSCPLQCFDVCVSVLQRSSV